MTISTKSKKIKKKDKENENEGIKTVIIKPNISVLNLSVRGTLMKVS